jgi:multiple sugar transport system substrate-binding protein
MEEISFSIFNHGQDAIRNLKTLLKQFEQEEKIRVRIEMIPWIAGWSRLAEIALYHVGPDISEAGSTWVMDFVRLNALRPYTPEDVASITQGRDYFQSCSVGGVAVEQGQPVTWAIPFGGDPRVIFYRRDLLKRAGINEADAFRTISAFEGTLAKLKASGVEIPLTLSTLRSNNSLHSLASWIWGLNGDFLSKDGADLEFDKTAALDGFKTYFGLTPYLGKTRVDEYDSDNLFFNGQAAVTISGYWMLIHQFNPTVIENLGMAAVPGTPFVGSENLVIWKHASNPEAALKLARFLSSPRAGEFLYPTFGLPPSPIGWERAPFDKPDYQVLSYTMLNGRTFPAHPLWGLIEKRLCDIMPEIWTQVFANPKKLDTIIEKNIGTVAQLLRPML